MIVGNGNKNMQNVLEKVRFKKTSSNAYMLTVDGVFAGWVERTSHKTAGLQSDRYYKFSYGDISATSLTTLRERIIAQK